MSSDEIKRLKSLLKQVEIKKRPINVSIDIKSDSPPETCVERLREAYAVMRACYDECYHALQVIKQRYQGCKQSELSDVLLALGQTSQFADDIRKEYDSAMSEIKKVVCERWITDPDPPTSIHGKYSLSIPAYKKRAKLPKYKDDPENYRQVMAWLGVPEDLQDHGPLLVQEGELPTKVIDINYPGFQSFIERLGAMGCPLPDFVEKNGTWDEACVTVRKTEDLL
jgi:hypothetical protein